MASLPRWFLSLILAASLAGSAFAEGAGQDDLDRATDVKLNAKTLSDLSEVIRLCESALEKGLDEGNAEFANKLLASTLLQRSHEVVKQLLAGVDSPSDFRQKRQFALADLEKAVKLDDRQPEAHLLIGQLQLLPGGNPVEARKALDRALELGLEEAASRAKALVLRAGLQEDAEKKIADLDEAIRLAPEAAAAVRARGFALADMNRLDAALVDLNRVIELAPNDAAAHEAKALVLGRQKKYDEALAALDRARQLNPDSVSPLVQRARVHAQQAKLDSALLDINQALAIDPSNVALLLMRASIYQEKGEKEQALIDVDRALKLKPDLPVALRTRALLLAESKRFDEAVVALETLRKLDPKDSLTLLQLAMLHGVQKQSGKAIEAYTAMLELAPDDVRALRGRGDAYLNVGRQSEAIADYEKALKLEPDDQGVLNNLAWVLATSPDAKLRDGRRAIELAEKACELSEYKLAHILSTLAAAYAETGDFDRAVEWSTKAVELGDENHGDALKKELESYKAKKPWRELLAEEKPAKTSPPR